MNDDAVLLQKDLKLLSLLLNSATHSNTFLQIMPVMYEDNSSPFQESGSFSVKGHENSLGQADNYILKIHSKH